MSGTSETAKMVYDKDAYAVLQKLRNGLLRDVIEEIGALVSDRPAEGDVITITIGDVKKAFVAVAQRYIEEQSTKDQKLPV